MSIHKYRGSILDHIGSIRPISTHSHHLDHELYQNMGLTSLLKSSYTNWAGPPPDIYDAPAFDAYLERNACNSFFRWLLKSLEEIYAIKPEGKTAPALDAAIRQAHEQNPNFHLEILQKHCRFDLVINDRQPNPGHNLGKPEFFKPSFRCDAFFSAYLKDKPDPNDFYAYSLFDKKDIDSLPEFLEQVRLAIKTKKQEGSVALKVAMAYERPLNFENTDLEKAAKAFNNPRASQEDIMNFGNLLMFEIARAAAEFSLPLQIHTGLGQGRKTNPSQLQKLIEANPETKFHILHGGFPWFDDTYALLTNFKNVFVDTCWIPYLSTHAAKRFFVEALETSDAHRLTWGDDAWMAEDSYGALLAMEHSLSGALASMVEDGAFGLDYAFYLADRILVQNAKDLFKL
ncbi:MAG: amidohydrolase family protein [Clostridiales bacterium]|nr:amidohydrolase family protein [Clostridiales bacterium]